MTLLVTRGDGNSREILASIPFTPGDVWLSAAVHVATDFRYAVQFDRASAAQVRAGLHPGAVVRSTEDFKYATERHSAIGGGGVGSVGARGPGPTIASAQSVVRNRPPRVAPTGPADSGRSGGNAGHPVARLPVNQRTPTPRPVAARTAAPTGAAADFVEGRRDTRLSAAEEYEAAFYGSPMVGR